MQVPLETGDRPIETPVTAAEALWLVLENPNRYAVTVAAREDRLVQLPTGWHRLDVPKLRGAVLYVNRERERRAAQRSGL